MTFSDIIKKSALEQFTGVLNPVNVIITMALAVLVGLFILFIYRKTFIGVMYSRSFGISLVMATMITALIILPITSNLTLSLGMVGALSIVRFRTAVKDAMDTMFLFWGIAVGICLGARFWQVAILGSLAIAAFLVILSSLKLKTALPYLLVLHYRSSANATIRQKLSQYGKLKLKSKTVRNDIVELTLEVRLKEGEDSIADDFSTLEGVYDASLLTYQGDVIS